MCKHIVRFSPGIRALYPENTVLLAALDTALAACAALDQAVAEVETPGV